MPAAGRRLPAAGRTPAPRSADAHFELGLTLHAVADARGADGGAAAGARGTGGGGSEEAVRAVAAAALLDPSQYMPFFEQMRGGF